MKIWNFAKKIYLRKWKEYILEKYYFIICLKGKNRTNKLCIEKIKKKNISILKFLNKVKTTLVLC